MKRRLLTLRWPSNDPRDYEAHPTGDERPLEELVVRIRRRPPELAHVQVRLDAAAPADRLWAFAVSQN